MTPKVNVYIINPVVMGFQLNLSNFVCLLVDSGKVLCSSANEHQQNSNASSREDYIPGEGKIALFWRERSDDRKCVCCSQATENVGFQRSDVNHWWTYS